MDLDALKRAFRTPAAADYPELGAYSRAQIYDGRMGPGGLYLAAHMARALAPAAGGRILDLGCGRGATSAFLARHLGATVVAVDLWVSATQLYERLRRWGVEDQVIPLNLDVTGPLPFAHGYFDAIFCMDSVHYYGGEVGFWHRLLPHLREGGRLCLGSPCFNEEFTAAALAALPAVYDDGSSLWEAEFSRYHSPAWWAALMGAVGGMEVIRSEALEDGIVLWEDDVLYALERGASPQEALKDAAQITFRQAGMPWLTHFLLCAVKAPPQAGASPPGEAAPPV